MTSQRKMRRSVEESALTTARSQIDKAVGLLGEVATDSVDHAIHQVRKRIKKARALLQLTRNAVGKKAVAKVDRRLREASRPLSSVRDASAMLVALDHLQERSADLVPVESFEEVRIILERHRQALRDDFLRDGATSAQVLRALRSASRRVSRWEIDDHHHGASPGLGRAYRRGRNAFWKARVNPSIDNLHDLRKRVKALGYQLKVLDEDPPNSVVRLRLLCRLLANDLGEGRDLDLLREFLDPLESAGPILQALNRRQVDLRQGSLQRAGVIFQPRPKVFVRSLKARVDELAEA